MAPSADPPNQPGCPGCLKADCMATRLCVARWRQSLRPDSTLYRYPLSIEGRKHTAGTHFFVAYRVARTQVGHLT
jgi:hypothetical protein